MHSCTGKWDNPVVGLLIVYFLVKEGIEAWTGRCECGGKR